jgi:hypothetical protein
MTGKVIFIGQPKVVSDKLTTQQFAIEYDKTTKNGSIKLKMAFDQRKTEKYDGTKSLNGISVGDEVEVQYNEPTSREYNGNWYTNVEAWSIKKVSGGAVDATVVNDTPDDMPF